MELEYLNNQNQGCICRNGIDEYNEYWRHLEAGAGNYGLDGHTKKSQRMTVFVELSYVSDAKNYFDDLPEQDEEDYNPNAQYALLFNTLDSLVASYGPKVIFYVNDLFVEYAEYAARQLTAYAIGHAYDDVIIEVAAGDYTKLIAHTTYDSVHLKNPEISFYHYGLDGSTTLSDMASRSHARDKLQYLANLSCDGLFFFPIDLRNAFIPQEEYEEFIEQRIFYHQTTMWPALPYIFPDGGVFSKEYGAVYFIKRGNFMPIIFIADPKILSVQIEENNDELIDIKDQSAIKIGLSPEIPNNTDYTKMRRTVYNKLVEAQSLLPTGLEFCLYEAYRSLDLQNKLFSGRYKLVQAEYPLWDHDKVFIETTRLVSPVINLDGSKNIPPHSTGAAIDVYLIDAQGVAVDMGIELGKWMQDLDGSISMTNSVKISEEARKNRDIMAKALTDVGFVNYPAEYWHWSYGDRYWAYYKKGTSAIYGSV